MAGANGPVTLAEGVALLDSIVAAVPGQVLAGLLRVANDGIADMAEQMAEPKTGVIYGAEQTVGFYATSQSTKGLVHSSSGKQVSFTAYKGKSGHQASAPGEAPAIDLGTLVNSLRAEQTGPLEVTISIGTGDGIAEWLEYGTAGMEARPFVLPAVEHTIRPGLAALKLDLEKP